MGKREKKSSNVKVIILLIVVLLIILGIVAFVINQNNNSTNNTKTENTTVEEFVQVLDNGTKVNISDKLKQTKELDEFTIGNIQYKYTNGISTMTAEVTNNSDKATELTDIKITLLDKEGNVISELEGLIAPLEAGAKTKLSLNVTLDLVNAYDFTIEKI